MYAPAPLELSTPLEMSLEETHDVRGAGLFADIGAVIDAAIPVIAGVVAKIS
jgi:hypothetical protein